MVIEPSVALAAAFVADDPVDGVDHSQFGQTDGTWRLQQTFQVWRQT